MPMTFARLGIPVRDASRFNYTVGPDASGRLNTVYISYFQSQAPWFAVGVNTETGECRHFQGARDEGCWAIATGVDGCIYTGSCTRVGGLNRIDPKSGAVTDLGTAVEGESYVWSLVSAADGKLYGGTYPNAKLFSYDPRTGAFADLGRLAEGEQYNRHLVAAGDLVYCSIGTVRPHVVAYDVRSGVRHKIELPGLDLAGIASLYSGEDGRVYSTMAADRYDNRSYAWRLDGLQAAPVAAAPPARLPALADGRRVAALGDDTLTLRDAHGRETTLPYHYAGAGALIFVLRNGPDGALYGSTALPLRLFRLDPATGAMQNLGNPTQTSGEIYSILAHGGRLVTCAYPRAALTLYEPQTGEGRHLGFVGDGQDRAPGMTLGHDGAIYIGTVPTYGELGGALVRLDPADWSWQTARNVVPEQSVVALAADPVRGRIYAGTSVGGGGGTKPTAERAVLFAWDCATQVKTGEWQPFADARSYEALAVSGRRLFGLTGDGRLFVFDLEAERLVHTARPDLGGARMGALVPHGAHLIAALGHRIVRIDAATFAIETLGEFPGLSAGFALHDGAVYFAVKAELVRGVLPA